VHGHGTWDAEWDWAALDLWVMGGISRRGFLKGAAVAGAAVGLGPRTVLGEGAAVGSVVWPENGTLIPDDGWRLWVDAEAKWAEDEIWLPEDVAMDAEGVVRAKGEPLPVNAPTGGWDVLGDAAGIGVVLPTTVEQHFWGKFGAGADGRPRPYTPEEYRYASPASGGVAPADDDVPKNGAYFGVSWWWRKIEIPEAMKGKRIFLHVRGARLRAEVYLNRRLVGYSIMEELPFECDLTHAAEPGGENVLAIRLTNPFGRFDWVDGANAKWGKLALYRSHGFGGLDRGMTVSAHDGVRIKDAWVLNDITPNRVYARCVTEAADGTQPSGFVLSEVIDPLNGKILNSVKSEHGPLRQRVLEFDAGLAFAHTAEWNRMYQWDLDHPKLLHMRTTWVGDDGGKDSRTTMFGLRSFGPVGLGTDAMFRLNGRRVRIYTSISWGYWGLNGLFPVPELAEKEVAAAKKLGLNCLNFHRNLAKEEVLRRHDEMGVLRYMEPGAGKLAIGRPPGNSAANTNSVVMERPTSEADKFAQRFMHVKCVEMVKAFRGHTSVIEYCLQNEIGADFKNPATVEILAAMRAEDPSRCIVLNDGFVAEPRKAAQAWYAPWDDKLHRSDEEPWGGWWNQHQGAGDQWYDKFYVSPDKFTYEVPAGPVFKGVITEYGEMEGCARPDDHTLMVHQITETYKKYGGTSYDLKDHEEIIAGYETFLDRWGFRKAFPTAESVFLACGRTSYESWANYLENVRISEELDFAAISGWESTAIENHSGIVDNLRNFKSDPGLIAGSLMPVRPIAKQRSLCVAQGESAVFDLYLANDTPTEAKGRLTFAMVTPSGKRVVLKTVEAPKQTADLFSYLLAEGFETPKLVEEGLYRFKFGLSGMAGATQTKEIWVTPTSLEQFRMTKVGVSGITPALRKQLKAVSEVVDFKPGEKYEVIVVSGMTAKTSDKQNVGETTGVEENPINAVQTTTELGRIDPAVMEAVRAGTPLLCMPQADSLSDGVAKQLEAAGVFKYSGAVGDFRAPWMGNWYFVREHALFAGMPVNQAMGGFYQVQGRQSNGVMVEGEGVEVVVGYSRDHDRKVGAGTLTAKLGKGKVVFHRVPEMHAVLQQRFLANALRWLTA
jgi:beta-galactosidase